MKKIISLSMIVAILFSIFISSSPAFADLGSYSWEGEWESNWGKMVLTQSGDKVTGTYPHDSGKIQGTVSGNTLTGTWSESPTYSAPNDAGKIIFTMAADGKSFSGKWGYGDSTPDGTWEGGKRLTEVIAAPTAAPAKPAPVTPSGDTKRFEISNIQAVQNGPSANFVFEPKTSVTVKEIMAYHYFNKGKLPGTIWLEDTKGAIVAGPWQAIGKPGQGNVANANWHVYPNANLSAGSYILKCSSMETWSTNSQAGNRGMGYIDYVESASVSPKPVPQPVVTPKPPSGQVSSVIPITGGTGKATTSAAPIPTGLSISFRPTGAIGYRLFRSTSSSDLGISVTDFYITSTNFADVNVEPNTTYYYTLKEVLAEAKPFDDIDEKLGETLATWTVTTGSDVNQGLPSGKIKRFIILKLDDPYMSVDGIKSEVDPGRGTSPIVYQNRTMVPIRAIIENMGGKADWTAAERKTGLTLKNTNLGMWIDKKNISINGQNKQMDVTPIIQNARTFLPIKFVGENLNSKVAWLNSTREIVITFVD